MKTTPLTPSSNLSRRDALKTLGASAAFLGIGLFSARSFAAAQRASARKTTTAGLIDGQYPFALPPLGYDYAALEPHIDARTMEIHHTKHHQAYITNANKALESVPALQALALGEMLQNLDSAPEALRAVLRNNIGGHANHAFFWQIIAPRVGKMADAAPSGALLRAIETTFGSLDAFKTQFADAAMKRFGSGWAWLVIAPESGKLSILSTANQDSPLLSHAVPLLGLDVWEHAYYLKYQNRRAEYVSAFWEIANWSRATSIHASVLDT